jgi:flagellar biosynthesis protein FlhF
MSTTAFDTHPGHAGYDTAGYETAAYDAAAPEAPARGPRIQGNAPGSFAPRIYRGRTVDELIPQIVAELGEDAIVIRRQRGLAGGFAGFFQRPFIEIEARRGVPGVDLYDEEDAAPAMPEDYGPPDAGGPTPAKEYAQSSVEDEFIVSAAPFQRPVPAAPAEEEPRQVWATNPFAAALAEAEAAVRAAEPAVPPELDEALVEALAEAEAAEAPVAEIAAPAPDLAVHPPETPVEVQAVEAPVPATTSIHTDTRAGAREEIEGSLRAVGIGEEFIAELIEAALAHVLPLMPEGTGIAQAVHAALTQRIPVLPPLSAKGAVIAFVGAGGSGKSTCCEALVEAYRTHSTVPAACYAISAIPEGAGSGEGLMLLDTPAISSADPDSIAVLAALLATLRPDRVVLTLPATLGATPAAQLLAAAGPLNANAIAITHADETDQLGPAVEAACRFGAAPVYLVQRAAAAGRLTAIDPHGLAERLLGPK